MTKNTNDEVIFTTNRGKRIRITAQYAKKTPKGFWEDVYRALRYAGVFDGVSK